MKYLLPLAGALTVLLTALLGIFIFFNPHGWDARLSCQAAELDCLGGNHYLAQNFPAGLPGQGNPAAEFGSINHPAFPFFFAALFAWPEGIPALLFGMTVGGLAAGALFWTAWRFFAPPAASRERPLFLLILPAFFLLLRRQNPAWQVCILLVAALYPALAFYVYFHWLGTASSALWAVYSQPIALLTSLLLLLAAEARRNRSLLAHA